MATENLTRPDDSSALEAAGDLAAIFEPFKWGSDRLHAPGLELSAEPAVSLAGRMQDMGNGIAVVLQLLESAAIDDNFVKDSDDRPLLDDYHRSVLLRLAIACSKSMTEKADAFLTWAEDRAAERGTM